MKLGWKSATAFAVMMAAAPSAFATDGWYGRVDVGYSFDGSESFDYFGAEDAEFDNDWMESLGLGYAFDNGFRLEGELSHRWNAAEGDFVLTGDGDVHAWGAMLNAYYDFNRGGTVQPYVGVGVGAARFNSNHLLFGTQVDDQATNWAWQAMAGLAFEVTKQLTLDVGYRYFASPEIELGSTGAVTSVDTDYEHQAATVGLRWQFAAPPPPPPPPLPPPPMTPPPPPPMTPPPAVACPTGEYVVYFEWDRSTLTSEAMQVIDAAVSRARQCNLNAVMLIGHTDRSGSTTYNQGLSERRASVVRDALVTRGIPAGVIQAQARGETEMARETRDGVREPLNRRTAITITFR